MTTLKTQLDLGTPLIWVNSDEPERVVDSVLLQTKRKVYKLDPFQGLVVHQDNKWVTVLVPKPEEGEGPCYDFQEAFINVYDEKGIFIIHNAHIMAKEPNYLAVFAGLYGMYRDAFQQNSADDLPPQLVLISCTGEIPPEIVRHVAIVQHDMPGPEDLAEVVLSINSAMDGKVLPEKKKTGRIVNSALGLSESEFIHGCLLSIKDNKKIDPVFINKFKLDKIKSGGVLEIRRPRLSLDDIGGMDNAKDIIRAIEWSWNNPDEAAKFGITPIRRMLMIGVPGTGKSAICEAVAKTLDLDLAKFGISGVMDKFVGESERKMRLAFRQIRAMAPLVCWGDELGRDLSGSGVSNDSGTTDRVHGEFLTGLQELPDDVLFMAAANRIDGIPPEMLRADRFDKIMFVGFPTLTERIDIFRIHLGDLAPQHDLTRLAQVTPMFTGAEIKSLIQEVKFKVATAEKRHITTDDLVSAAPGLKNRLWIKHRGEVLAMYARAQVEWDWASSEQLAESEMILNGTLEVAPIETGNKLVQGWG